MESTKDTLTHLADGGAVTIGVSTFFGLLPDLAALLTVIWLGLRIWESDTVQNFIKHRKRKD